jgi:hypothetical protein
MIHLKSTTPLLQDEAPELASYGSPEIDFRKVTFYFLLFLLVCYGLSTFEVENPNAAKRLPEK